jgi:nucleoside-diphosphate-sugar epimerase
MKVLLLGGYGFIGCVLSTYLHERGDEVTVLDTLLFEQDEDVDVPGEFVRGDIRSINDFLPALAEADAVVNLAAMSNDPASDLLPELTWEINYKANETIAQLCQATGKRIVYASSCSVYGFSNDEVFTESSRIGPVTLYAQTKMLSEHLYLHESIDSVVLRFATVYGFSPKTRFDLVVNTMIGSGLFQGKIFVNGGSQWRPVVHVKDVAQAIYLALHAENPKHRVYNVGSNEQNYQISTLGEIVTEELANVEFVHLEDSLDKRSYNVDFSLIKCDLGFEAEYTVADAVAELRDVVEKGMLSGMEDEVYYRVKYLKNLYAHSELLDSSPYRNYFLPLRYAMAGHYGGVGANGH